MLSARDTSERKTALRSSG